MSSGVVVLERITRVAPFGVRLWDPASAKPAGPGLAVAYRPDPGGPGGRPGIPAIQNRSGIQVLRGLPGLGETERGDGDQAFWAAPPATGTYRIEVSDPEGRYLPLAFDAALPARDLFEAACGLPDPLPIPSSPPASPPDGSPPSPRVPVVPVFSSPTRPIPPGAAALRAQLHLAPAGPGGPEGPPASWALLEVTLPGRSPALGLADGQGRATVVFPYPEPEPSILHPSPPGPGTTRLSDHTWTLGVQVYFGVGVGSPPAIPPVAGSEGVPDLCDLLQQHPATVLADELSTPLTTAQLHYGRELVLRTGDRSTLLLVPSTAPPPP